MLATRTLPVPPATAPLPVVSASVSARDPDAASALARALSHTDLAVIFIFASPEADLDRLATGLGRAFGTTPVVGCTTAGEISARGYCEGEIVALGLSATAFAARTVFIPDLTTLAATDLMGQVIAARHDLTVAKPQWRQEFGFLMVDGLSIREDELTAALAAGLGPVPLFGGSAGDGTRFQQTFVLAGGRFHRNAAALTLVRSACGVKVFSLDHLIPTAQRMVVTEADPARRIVRQINAEPAAREYARLLGKDPTQLTAFTFAAHPVVVRIGGRHHVRAIQQMDANGDLVFFSAIDEGLVLTLAEPQDMARHLDDALAALCEGREPAAIIGCDCILRRMEAQEKQSYRALSQVLARHKVVGFSTYGEQYHSMHVNQTMTGVVLFPPDG